MVKSHRCTDEKLFIQILRALVLTDKKEGEIKFEMLFERYKGASFINIILVDESEIKEVMGNYTEAVEILAKFKKAN